MLPIGSVQGHEFPTLKKKIMKTKEELMAMSHEELADFATNLQTQASLYKYTNDQNARLKEILAAIGIAYETYKRENNAGA